MSLSVAVSTIQERARNRLTLPAFTTSTPVTTAMALDFVQASAQMLSGMIGRAYPDGYFAANATLTTQVGLSYVSLPADFTYLTKATWLVSSTRWVEIEPAGAGDVMPSGLTSQAWVEGDPPKMRLRGNTIELYPTPSAVYSIAVNYTTALLPTSAASVMALQAGWDEWMVLDFSIKCRQAEQKPADDFIAQQAKVESFILSNAKMRDKRPQRMRDARSESSMRGGPVHVSRWR